MNIRNLCIAIGAATGLIGISGAAIADGKATFEAACAECHDATDFDGETIDDIKEMISQIMNGEIKHKTELKLSDQEAADIAAYFATGGK